MDTSATLLEALQSPESSQSWAILSDLYGPMIRKWLAKNNVAIDDRDDIAQEVLLQVANRIKSFEHSGRKGAFRNWLKQITINCLRNYGRKKANRLNPVGGTDFRNFLDQLSDPQSVASQNWDKQYRKEVLSYLLKVVKQRFQSHVFEAFYQTAVLNQEPRAVAESLEISVAAIYTARSRVLKELMRIKDGLIDEL